VSVGVVLAAGGYPQSPRKGDVIQGLAAVPGGSVVFHAGTRETPDGIVTSGGRVLTVCAHGDTLVQARERAYAAAAAIHFDGVHLRRDIGAHALGHAV
jgi:phosphoribosylamine--glycine ligase